MISCFHSLALTSLKSLKMLSFAQHQALFIKPLKPFNDDNNDFSLFATLKHIRTLQPSHSPTPLLVHVFNLYRSQMKQWSFDGLIHIFIFRFSLLFWLCNLSAHVSLVILGQAVFVIKKPKTHIKEW